MDITCDQNRSAFYRKRLEQYLTTNVLSDNQFLCEHYKKCRDSHIGTFYEGQLHYAGHYYDLAINKTPFRILVIGMSYGHKPAHVSMESRYQMVAIETGLEKRFYSDGDHKDRNPHMRGTTSLLRLLLGIPLGSDYESEFFVVNKRDRCHLFDAFSLVNYLLCSAVEKENSTTDKSTKEMKANCREHFRNCLKILEPNVVILQGKGFKRSIISSLDRILSWDDKGVLFDAEIMSHKFTLALFSHPSARNYHTDNWGADDHTPYLLNVVMPSIKRIRQKILGID